MATRMEQLLMSTFSDLRMQPVSKWIRATAGTSTVVDTCRARLVWEPRRIVPSYAVPDEDLTATLVPAPGLSAAEHPVFLEDGGPVLDPRSPFAAHTASGTPLTIRTATGELPGAAFRPDDPDLVGYVILDWDAFDQWYEEDEPVLAHPHDPFHRIDCLRSSRHVQIEHKGVTLADTTRPTLLFETHLPTRFYIPREDVALDLMQRSESRSVCAYKGRASYWSATVRDTLLPDIAWSYEDPLADAVPVRDLMSFYSERLTVIVDGETEPAHRTPWS